MSSRAGLCARSRAGGRLDGSAGRVESAYRRLWTLGRTPAAEATVQGVEQVRHSARALIAGRLGELEQHVPAEGLERLRAEASRLFATT